MQVKEIRDIDQISAGHLLQHTYAYLEFHDLYSIQNNTLSVYGASFCADGKNETR